MGLLRRGALFSSSAALGSTVSWVIGILAAGQASITNPTIATGSVVVSVGDLIVATFSELTATGTLTGVTDNLGNTYTAASAGLAQSTTWGRTYYSIVTVGGTLTAVNFAATASTNDVSVEAVAFKGPFSGSDSIPAVRGDGTTSFTGTATGTLSNDALTYGVLVIGAISHSSTSGTLTANSGFTIVNPAPVTTGLRRVTHQWLNVASTASVTPSFAGVNDNTVVQTLSFKRTV
jgi:hypothetical protein